jgi:hypothetical protein
MEKETSPIVNAQVRDKSTVKYTPINIHETYVREMILPTDRQININVANLVIVYLKYFPSTNFVNTIMMLASKVKSGSTGVINSSGNIPLCTVFGKLNIPDESIMVMFDEVQLILDSKIHVDDNGTIKYTTYDVDGLFKIGKDGNINVDDLYITDTMTKRNMTLSELLTFMAFRSYSYATRMLQQVLPIADIYEIVLCAILEPLDISSNCYVAMLYDEAKYFDACIVSKQNPLNMIPIHSIVLRMSSKKMFRMLSPYTPDDSKISCKYELVLLLDCDFDTAVDFHNIMYSQYIDFDSVNLKSIKKLMELLIQAEMMTTEKLLIHFLHMLLYRPVRYQAMDV